MLSKKIFRFIILCFAFVVCVNISTFAAVSAAGGGGGGNSGSSSGGAGGYTRSSARSAGGGGGYSSASSGGGGGNSYSSTNSGSGGGLSDEAFENNGWTVVSRGSKCILLSDGNGDYTVYKYSGGYAGHQYLNWYVENVWNSNEDFDYDKFLSYVNKNQKNLDRAFGSRLYFDGSVKDLESGNFIDADFEDDDDDDDDDNYVNNLETYGKILASNCSQWVKNQDGTYSLFYVDALNNQPTIASNGFFTIVDSTNNYNINTYYFDNKGIMVTTPFITQSGQAINFASTGEVIR